MASLDELLSSLAPLPETRRRGEQFERICEWLLQHEPVYRHRLRHVWRWEHWPGRWGPDLGIDLVAEETDGSLWAVQAKLYGQDAPISKGDVDSFLAECARGNFSFQLIIATTDVIGRNARAVLRDQRVSTGVLLRSDLEDLDLDWPASIAYLDEAQPRPQRLVPWPSSEEAVRAVVSGLGEHDRGQLLMACGTGKTLVGLWVAEKLGAESVLVLVPSLSLLAQTLKAWRQNWVLPRDVLVVCSDKTAGTDDDSVDDSAGLGVPVTTDYVQVRSLLAADPRPRLVLCTYQSAEVVASAAADSGHRFDLLIADEAHRCAGVKGAGYAIATKERLPAHKRLFMTATPRILSSRLREAAGDADDVYAASMDDPVLFGPVLHSLSFGAAISRGLLTDYRVVVIGLEEAEVAASVERRDLYRFREDEDSDGVVLDLATAAAAVGVARACDKYGLRRLVTFHNTVKGAADFARLLPRLCEWVSSESRITAGHVNGRMTARQRRVELGRLLTGEVGAPRVLTNARCLTEGVDVPSLDGVAFIDPKSSQIDIVQAVGRAIRSSDAKDYGTIILPVLLPTDLTGDGMPIRSAFEPIWRVLRALRAHDETLADELDALRRALGRRGRVERLPGRIVLDLPANASPKQFESMTLRILEGATEDWQVGYGLLQAYEQREGTTRMPTGHIEADFPLGRWVSSQRSANNRGQLREDRVRALSEMKDWTWHTHDDAWQRMYAAAQEYASINGHFRPTQKETFAGLRIGRWANEQRTARGRLSAEDEAALESLPGWTWGVYRDTAAQRQAAMAAYLQREGHLRAPYGHVEQGVALGTHMARMRKLYRRGGLARAVIAALDAVSTSWRDGLTEGEKPAGVTPQWTRAYELLVKHIDQGGDSRLPQDAEVEGFRLGTWTHQQRRLYREGSLTEEQTSALAALPGWTWSPQGDLWEVRFAEYLAHRGAHGNEVPAVDGPHGAIGRWIYKQRSLRRLGRLRDERASRLEAIDGWSWDNAPRRRT